MDKIYIFKKSGSLVKIVSTTKLGKETGYIVERIDSGKQLIVPKDSLIELTHVWEEK